MDLLLIEYLGGIVFKLMGLKAERKQEVAAYMESISQTIGKFGPRLREGAPLEELRGYATETHELTKRFAAATSDVLPESERKELIKKLEGAFNAKDFLSRAGEQREQLLVFLGEAAGTFRAAAATLKAGAHKLR
jgi:hypothetical protein